MEIFGENCCFERKSKISYYQPILKGFIISGHRPGVKTMTIEELNAVVAVSRFKSFAEAAGYLAVSPAIISKYVSRVEEELGVVIFERATKSKPITYTPAGRIVIRDIRNMMNHYTSLLASVQTINNVEEPVLSVGFAPNIGLTKEEAILADFIYKNPTLTVKLISGGMDKLLSCLMSNVTDGVFLRLSEWDFEPGSWVQSKIFNPDLETIDIRSTRTLALFMNTEHELAKKRLITQDDIHSVQESTLLLNSRSTYVNSEQNKERAFALFNGSESFRYIMMDEENTAVLLKMMRAHKDLILPICIFDEIDCQGFTTVPVKDWNVCTHMVFVHRKNNISRPLRRLISMLTELADM